MDMIYGAGWWIAFLSLVVFIPRARGCRKPLDHALVFGIMALFWLVPALYYLIKAIFCYGARLERWAKE